MLAIDKAKYLADYNIHLFFNDGKEGIANLEKTIFHDKRQIFSNLKGKSEFRSFTLKHGTIVWPNGLAKIDWTWRRNICFIWYSRIMMVIESNSSGGVISDKSIIIF